MSPDLGVVEFIVVLIAAGILTYYAIDHAINPGKYNTPDAARAIQDTWNCTKAAVAEMVERIKEPGTRPKPAEYPDEARGLEGVGPAIYQRPATTPNPRPQGTPTPAPRPVPTIVPVDVTPTSTPQHNVEYVADSNIFMDRVSHWDGNWRDNILSDPNNVIYVPHAVDQELNWASPTEAARRAGQPGGASIISIPDGDLRGLDTSSLESRKFDLNDMKIIQSAKERNIPLITMNSSMQNQIQSHPERKSIWGTVQIVTP